jgi:hypothetical protein
LVDRYSPDPRLLSEVGDFYAKAVKFSQIGCLIHVSSIFYERMSEDLIQKLAAGKLFRLFSFIQLSIHLAGYIGAFIKLIIIEAGGYYDVSILRFLGITLISMPLFAIGWQLVQSSLKLAKRQRFGGYCFHLLNLVWSIAIVAIGYFV